MEESKKKSWLDKSVDFIFAKNNTKYVLLFFIIGFLLRAIISIRIPFYADEMGYAVHSIRFIDSGKLQIHDQDAIWFFMTDLFMKVFSYNVFGLRFFSVICGSLSVILVYLIAKEIFDEKIALISSFIMAVSSFSVINTIGEMDVPMAFFGLLSMYFLILFLKTDKNKFFYITWITLGITIMIKQIAILFIPAFVLFMLYYNKTNHKNFKVKQIFYAALIIIIMVVPVLTYNYLLYKDKGIVDMQFSRFFGIAKEQYASIANTLNPFSLKTLFISHAGGTPGFVQGLNFLYLYESLIVLIFSTVGIGIIAISKNKFKWLLFLSLLFPFIFLSGTSLLANHFVFLTLFTSLFSAKGILFVSDKISNRRYSKFFILGILLLISLSGLIQINQETNGFFGKNEISKLIDTKEKLIDPNALVVVDSRIYRGRIAFSFWDRHYLETNYFIPLTQEIDTLPGKITPIKVYFVEAVTDDSGWGSVKSQPEFNKSNEELVKFFEENSNVISTINDLEGNPHFRVYEGTFNLKQSVIDFADTTHEFFFYPVAYTPENKIFDKYDTYNLLDSILDKLAHIVLYLEVIITILLLFLVFFLIHKNS